MKIGVLLSGSGVYDGSEIQEAVFTLLAIDELGYESVCISLDKNQHHVVNHITGEEMSESRNMLIESARIARGAIKKIEEISPRDIDALIIPGGFGNAKNLTTWAFSGPDGMILPEVKLLLVNLYNAGKPLVALCVSPVVLAKAFEDSSAFFDMTIGSIEGKSPYDIQSFEQGIERLGNNMKGKFVNELCIDEKNRIITAPCYMMEASISEIRNNIKQSLEALKLMLEK